MNTPIPFLPQSAPPKRGKSAVCLRIRKFAASHTLALLLLCGALCALVFSSIQVQAGPGPTGQSGVQLTIELRDGSRIVGNSGEETLSCHSATLGDLKLPWEGIRSIDYAGTNSDAARLTAANGDGFTVRFSAETLRVESAFGQIALPVKLIRSVKVAPPAPQAKPNDATGSELLRLTIELRDGSQVVGKSLEDSLSFRSPAMGELKLMWASVRSIEYAGANTETARLATANGDVYEVQFAAQSLGVETSFGKSELPVKLIRSIKVSAAGQSGQLSSGLVARWLGDSNAKDSTGHFDGQVARGVSYVPGPTGQAFQLNGGGAQVDFGNSAGNFGTCDFTIAFWMKTDTRNVQEGFLAKRAACHGNSIFWEIMVGGGGNPPPGIIDFVIEEGDNLPTDDLVTSRRMTDGQWHHYAWVRHTSGDGKTTGRLYVDGVLDCERVYPKAVDLTIQAPLVLGQNACQFRDTTRPFSGAAADLRLFSRALSAEEIINIYLEARPGGL